MVFHPCEERMHNRIAAGRIFSFSIVFNDPSSYTCIRFTVCLHQYLEETKNDLSMSYHFAIESFSQCETRNPETIRRESWLLFQHQRIVLQFITPLNLKNSKRKAIEWQITEEKLISLIGKRMKSFFSLDMCCAFAEFHGFHCFPYYWKYASSSHQSKSNGQTLLLNGYRGFLPLENISEYLLNLLLICSEIHIGDRTTYASGYFIVRKNFPFFDHQLRDRQFIRAAIGKIRKKCERNGNLIIPFPSTDTLLAGLTMTYQHEAYNAFPLDSGDGRKLFSYHESYTDWIIEKIIAILVKHVFRRVLEAGNSGDWRDIGNNEDAQRIPAQSGEDRLRIFEAAAGAFFTMAERETIMEKVKRAIPGENTITLRIIEQTINAPIVFHAAGTDHPDGLPAESPLYPLLAHLLPRPRLSTVGKDSDF